MARCILTNNNGAIQATLHDAPRAPNTTWSRTITDGKAIFHRRLKRKEAYSALRHGQIEDLESLSPGIKASPDASLADVKVGRQIATPAAMASWNGDSIDISFALLNANGSTTDLPKNLDIDNEQGYVVADNSVVFYTEDGMRELRGQCLGNANLPLENHSLSYRAFLALRGELDRNGLNIICNFDAADVMTDLHEKRDKQTLHMPALLADDIELRDYQREALEWLQFCHANELGALLAFDMGLGKTCTTIALLAHVHLDGTSLVICPLSIITNWAIELHKFAPALKVRTHYGSNRLILEDQFLAYDVILTTYETLRSDLEILSGIKWNAFVIDEAQRIKNPDSGTSRTCRRIHAKCPLALTGTPFENRPRDLWTIMDFLEPGFLGTSDEFYQTYGRPIAQGDEFAIDELKSQVSLFMLRKKKEDVLDDLPELVEVNLPLNMNSWESREYNRLLDQINEHSSAGIDLGAITNLLQFCSHPSAINAYESPDPVDESNKYSQLVELLLEVIRQDDKAIVFASWIGMLNMMESDLPDRVGARIFRIDGGVEQCDRQRIIDDFSNTAEPAVLIGNHKTLGVGLNITAANHVIHYSGVWNPAVLDQATDRTHRIGQTKTVWAYYLYYVNTVDQLLKEAVDRKRLLGEALVEDSVDKLMDEAKFLDAVLDMRPMMNDQGMT